MSLLFVGISVMKSVMANDVYVEREMRANDLILSCCCRWASLLQLDLHRTRNGTIPQILSEKKVRAECYLWKRTGKGKGKERRRDRNASS